MIAVVGDIKPQETLKLIEKYFGRIPASSEKKNVIPAEPIQTEERRVEVTFDANPMMIIGFHKPNAPAYEDYVFDVLETILTQRQNQPIVQQAGHRAADCEKRQRRQWRAGNKISQPFHDICPTPSSPHKYGTGRNDLAGN